jgi:hypothetical protein
MKEIDYYENNWIFTYLEDFSLDAVEAGNLFVFDYFVKNYRGSVYIDIKYSGFFNLKNLCENFFTGPGSLCSVHFM